MSGFEKLIIYQKSIEGTKEIYNLVSKPAFKRDFSLVDQIKRAAMSVTANIAEGYGRNSKKEKYYFLTVSLGSANEVIAFLDIIQAIYNLDVNSQRLFYTQLGKQIYTFRNKLH